MLFGFLGIPLFALLAAVLVAANLGLGLWLSRRVASRRRRLLLLIGLPIAGYLLAAFVAALWLVAIVILNGGNAL